MSIWTIWKRLKQDSLFKFLLFSNSNSSGPSKHPVGIKASLICCTNHLWKGPPKTAQYGDSTCLSPASLLASPRARIPRTVVH